MSAYAGLGSAFETDWAELRKLLDPRTAELVERRRATPMVRRGWLVRRMLAGADVFGLSFAFLIAEYLLGRDGTGVDHIPVRTEFLLFMITMPLWVVVAKLYGLYDHDEESADHSTADEVVSVFHLVTVGTWLVVAGSWATGIANPDLPKLFLFWLLAVGLISTGRGVARAFCRRQIAYLQNTIIVGAGDVGQLIARKLLKHPEYGLNLVGFVDAAPKVRRGDLPEHLAVIGGQNDLPRLIELLDVERVVVAFSNDTHFETLELVRSLRDRDLRVDIVPRLFEVLGPNFSIHSIEGLPLVSLPSLRLARSSRFLKRGVDLLLSSVALLLLSPLLAAIALVIRLDSKGPVFFRQVRMGEHDLTFRIFKFRTMAADADARKHEVAHLNQHLCAGGDPRMFKIADDPRVTRVGRLLRETSLDELPQLLNVLIGEMSLVGPRPLILDEDQHVLDWGRERLSLKPGITGPWQVLGRTGIPFEEMVKLDYLYVTGWSLLNDLKLILRTLPALARKTGA